MQFYSLLSIQISSVNRKLTIYIFICVFRFGSSQTHEGRAARTLSYAAYIFRPLFYFDLIDLTIVESRKKHSNKEANRNGENNARMRKNRNKRFGRVSWKFFSFAVLRAPKYRRCHTERLLARYKFMNHNDAAMFRFFLWCRPDIRNVGIVATGVIRAMLNDVNLQLNNCRSNKNPNLKTICLVKVEHLQAFHPILLGTYYVSEKRKLNSYQNGLSVFGRVGVEL